MGSDRFVASAQYNDWKGSAAADRSDINSPEKWLVDNGHMRENEFLLGIKMYAGETRGVHKDPIFVDFLLVTPGEHDSVKAMIDAAEGPINVRKVSFQMNLVDFLGLFKRFSVAISSHGMFDNKDYFFTD